MAEGRKGRASFRRACLSLAGHERRDAQNDAAEIGAQRSHGAQRMSFVQARTHDHAERMQIAAGGDQDQGI